MSVSNECELGTNAEDHAWHSKTYIEDRASAEASLVAHVELAIVLRGPETEALLGRVDQTKLPALRRNISMGTLFHEAVDRKPMLDNDGLRRRRHETVG